MIRFFSDAHIVGFQKAIQAFSGFAIVLLVSNFLTPIEQGYYYAMGSLLSSYTLLDLGLSSLLVQVSARYFHGLSWDKLRGNLLPVGPARSAMLSLSRWALAWYSKLGLLTLLLIPMGIGYFYFAKSDVTLVAWQMPWVFIVLAVAVSMPFNGLFALIEGTGAIREIYIARTACYLLGASFAAALIFSGYGLYALSAAPVALSLVAIILISTRYRSFPKIAWAETTSFSYKTNLMPQHGRVAIAWASNYVFLQSPTLIIFLNSGAVVAGQVGLSIVVANVLGAIAFAPVTAIAPRFTNLIHQGDDKQAQDLFLRAAVQSCVYFVLAFCVLLSAVWFLQGFLFASRILPLGHLGLLVASFAILHFVNIFMIYFRAFGEEPFAVTIFCAYSGYIALAICLHSFLDVARVFILLILCNLVLMLRAFVLFMRLKKASST